MERLYTFTSLKYPRTPHRRWTAYGPYEDGQCLLFVRRDTVMRYAGTRRRVFLPGPSWEFIWTDRGYKMALWFRDDGRFGGVYADVCLPPSVDPERAAVEFLDLDLDIVARKEQESGTLRVQVLDRDEFLRNRRALHYPGTLSAFAEGALGRLLSDVSRRRYPLDRPLSAWRDALFARLAELPEGMFDERSRDGRVRRPKAGRDGRQEVPRGRRSL